MKTCQKQIHVYEGRRCGQCSKVRNIAWRKANPEKMRIAQVKYRGTEKKRHWQLKSKYGITIDQYNDLFSEQNGRCKICDRHQSELKKSLYVDHCHTTERVRGLLCLQCNFALGLIKDDVSVLKKIETYLRGDRNA